MQLDDPSLRQLIALILSTLKEQNEAAVAALPVPPEKQKTIFVIWTAPWDNRFYAFVDCLKTKKGCRLCGLVSPNLSEWAIERLRELASWDVLEIWDQIEPPQLENSITVVPVTRRDTIVKIALCMSDTFETRWIRSAMEQGATVVLPRNGFDRFTGSEPKKYQQKVLSYYRDLLEMNMELPESFDQYLI